MPIKKEIILFIGGPGFIGSHLINKYQKNHNIINISNKNKL